jgi:SulP family sulfate permease
MVEIVRHAPDANPYTLGIGVGILVITMLSERISPRVPGALIGLAGAALAVAGFHLEAHGVTVLKTLPSGLPPLTLPTAVEVQNIFRLLPAALVVAAVCMMQTAAVVRSFPSAPDQPENVSRDFAGVGAGCVLAGLIGAFAVRRARRLSKNRGDDLS